MDLSKLYPPVEFPVSRGTQTISSLIKWDHSNKFYVMDYEAHALKAERPYYVTLSDSEYEFMQGHLIDGKLNNKNLRILNHPFFNRTSAHPSNWIFIFSLVIIG